MSYHPEIWFIFDNWHLSSIYSFHIMQTLIYSDSMRYRKISFKYITDNQYKLELRTPGPLRAFGSNQGLWCLAIASREIHAALVRQCTQSVMSFCSKSVSCKCMAVLHKPASENMIIKSKLYTLQIPNVPTLQTLK